MSQQEDFENQLLEMEREYGGTERTSRMLEQLREAHGTGVDTLVKLGTQTEQLTNIAKLSQEQESYVSGLGKYKKFNKYMKRWKKGEEPTPQPKEVHHEVNRIKVKHVQDVKIYNNKQAERERLEREAVEKRQKELEDQKNNPFQEDEESRFSKGLSRIWKNDALSSGTKQELNYAADNHSSPITRQSEIDQDIQNNSFIKRSKWLEVQDQQLDEMSDILNELKNISVATHSELKVQSLKLDDISASVDKGSDFSLKRKSQKQMDKEKKKQAEAEKKRLEKEEKTRKDIDKKLKSSGPPKK
ncbi:culmination specific protein 37D [Tieghemostelium lacteum]|uniref:Culmination specific protein 37D n=1 Tax=Tieghemostelium lacteum TaxID=361077 RepID=A0A151Z9S7_TIELA|nr:culmination specific protein 37D [Tieghemostelium lacteum]|eukprot:KYQ90686.1 culmination specific protein 37D [Tieghemostelium lacteum]